MRLLHIAVVITALASSGIASAIDGSWRGNLRLGLTKLPLVFNFTEGQEGAVNCTMDSPNQGVKGLPTEVIFCSHDSISLRCASIGATYRARIKTDSIEGTFSQRGLSFPLTLTEESAVGERFPQTPRPPYNYESTDTLFISKDGTRLAGTLVIPYTASSVKMPVVVMVTGSGPQNRDEEILGHRPFAVIADRLAAKGIASFRYDDRGVGKSEGNFWEANTYTFADDAEAALNFVRTLPQTGKAGILGHSEGGTISFMLGASGKPDFIISLAGMAVNSTETLIEQNRHALSRAGIHGPEAENAALLISKLFEKIKEQYNAGKTESIDIDMLAEESGIGITPMLLKSIKANTRMRTRQFDCLLSIEPSQWLSKIECPLFAANGDKDTQVNSDSNLKAISEAVKDARVKKYPGLNHLLQHCSTGESDEYGEISETISEELIEDMADFIISVTR